LFFLHIVLSQKNLEWFMPKIIVKKEKQMIKNLVDSEIEQDV